MVKEYGKIRSFDTGATRDSDEGKHDFEGFLSPIVINRFGEYMTKHRKQSDGSLRASDNWQKGIPKDQYMKSLLRHIHDMWTQHRGLQGKDEFEESICAVLFNTQGYLHELLKERGYMSKNKELWGKIAHANTFNTTSSTGKTRIRHPKRTK